MPEGSAIVTGAASGIGRAIALRLATDGLHVFCCDVRQAPEAAGLSAGEERTATDTLAVRDGFSAEFVQCDVCSESDLECVGDLVRRRSLPLRAVVANAGIFPGPESILTADVASHRRIMAVNEEGAWLTCRLAARLFTEQGTQGRIVLTASMDGLVAEPESVSYCSSKGAVVSMTRAIALDLAAHGTTVNCVCPGCIETPLTAPALADPGVRAEMTAAHPLGRLGRPSDVAGAVAFLVSDDAAWLTGVALPVDGGYTCK